MARRLIRIAVALMLLGLVASTASAQDTLLSELYGQGVHAYFAGDFEKAHRLFTMAIEQGSRDPRCFYFRGLAYHRLGRPEEGVEDFKKGAELEAAGEAVQVDVGSSLQRVQGSTRLELENYRYQARLTAHVEEVRTRQQRYEQFRSDEPRVIRRPDAGIDPVELPSGPAPDRSDPFAADPDADMPADIPAEATVAEPPEPAVEQPVDPSDEGDPFADPPEPVVVPPADDPAPAVEADDEADDDPFGFVPTPAGDLFDTPAAPATLEEELLGTPADAEAADGLLDTPMEPEVAPATREDDPFGAAAPATADDPFGAAMEPEAAPADPAAQDDDPFGAPPAADDPFGAAMEPEAAPADPEDDPLGAPPAADDPFGAPPAADDPFGAPPAADDPFAAPAPGAPQPADEANPFVDDEPMGDEAEEDSDEEEADDTDPFGG